VDVCVGLARVAPGCGTSTSTTGSHSHSARMEPSHQTKFRDGGISLSNPVHFPSTRRLHQFGSASLGGLAAPPFFPAPRAIETPRTQRSVSLAYPLCSRPDEIVNSPAVWPRAQPNPRLLKFLHGAGDDSARLGPFDRTAHQPMQDVTRQTSYTLDYCRAAALRTTTLPPLPKRVPIPEQQVAALNWVEDDGRSPEEINRAARFGIIKSGGPAQPFGGTFGVASLDAPYDPSSHGRRAVVPPADYELTM